MSGTHRRSRLIRVFAITFALTALSAALYAGGPPQEPQAGRYIIQFHNYGRQAPDAVVRAGGRVALELPEQSALAAYLPERALEALAHNPNVKLIEVDQRRHPMSQTQPYGIAMVQADQVTLGSGASGVKVCIIDSGYYTGHEDLSGTNVGSSPDSGTGDPFLDKCSHGTHVAGTIRGLDNSLGVVGVVGSTNLPLHIVKVFGDNCSWTYSSTLVSALNKCTQAGAKVVSMSLGGSFSSTTENNAFQNAYNNGVLSVAAAGNGGNTRKSYPASYNSVISVAAIDQNKALASFSQRNDQVELAAPGVGVLSTVTNESSASAAGNKYNGGWIEGSATSAGTSGALADGGLCTSAGSWSGKVVVCQRGSISFAEKVANVKNGGGAAAVIYNNVSGGFSGTLNGSSTIPAVSLSDTDGQALLAFVGQNGTVVSNQYPGSGYAFFDGTSMATPHVSGVAALVWSNVPTKTNAEIRQALQQTAQDLGSAGRDNSYGYGLVQAKAALDFLNGGGTPDPDPDPDPEPEPGGFSLSASGRKVKGIQHADLSWTGATSANVDVYRDGTLITTTANDGAHTDNIGKKGGGSYTYQVCEAGTSTCSNTATVTF